MVSGKIISLWIAAVSVFLWSSALSAQDYTGFYEKSLNNNNAGMYVLGAWAVTNMVTGGIGWNQGQGSNKYFHQMNLFWNVVNLSIAGIALYGNHNFDYSGLGPDELLNRHIRIENILLINAGLDVVYIGTGFLLRHLSTVKSTRTDLLKGYGNSLILQGGFLFAFDLVLYGVLRYYRAGFIESLSVSPGALSLSFSF